ncbi:MAG: tRNA lysidine(34) synthetase TilS [Candidatus Omnitrophota bacterium]
MKKLTYSAFLKNVKDTIKHYDMLRKGDRVLVAVSGGADSVCLMKSLLEIRGSLGVEVIIANLDHGLRGAESAADSRFVKDISKQLNAECVMGRCNVKKTGKKDLSTEERAREERYRFLIRTAKKKKCGVIATGHTMDDQAETVLMKILHGSSISGLTGIPPVREEGVLRIIRPLIRIERKNILDFLKDSKLSFVEDSSNKDMNFRRNRVRLDILPYLEKYSPKLRRTLVNLSDTLREDLFFIEEAKKKVLVNKGLEGSEIRVSDLISQSRTVRKDVLKDLFAKTGGNIKKLTYRHWIDMDYFVRTASAGQSLDLPGKVKIVKTKDKIVFEKKM